jgi:hypothetical protein
MQIDIFLILTFNFNREAFHVQFSEEIMRFLKHHQSNATLFQKRIGPTLKDFLFWEQIFKSWKNMTNVLKMLTYEKFCFPRILKLFGSNLHFAWSFL